MSHPQNGVSRLQQLSGKHTVAPSRPIFEKPLKIRCFRMVFNKVLQRTRKSSFRGVVLTESTLLELLVTTLYPKTRVWPLILVLEAAIRRESRFDRGTVSQRLFVASTSGGLRYLEQLSLLRVSRTKPITTRGCFFGT